MMEQSVEKHGYRRIAIGIVLLFCLFWIGKRWYDAQHPKPLNPMEIAAQITAIQVGGGRGRVFTLAFLP